MSKNKKLLVELFDIQSLIDPRLIEDLDRLDQLNKIAAWYNQLNPIPQLMELAERQLQQNLEAGALAHFTDTEFETFRANWWKLSAVEQRSLLREQAGLPEIELISDSIY